MAPPDYRDFYTLTTSFSYESPICAYTISIDHKTEAEKRRNTLFYKYCRKKDIPYKIGRIAMLSIVFLISFGIACIFAWFINSMELGMILGFLASMLCMVMWDHIENFKFEIEDRNFVRRKRK